MDIQMKTNGLASSLPLFDSLLLAALNMIGAAFQVRGGLGRARPSRSIRSLPM
jgi:hypothetical protein